MKSLLSFTLVASYFLLMPSCKTAYSPTMLNVPLFKEKKELQATIGFTNNQLAYAVTNNIGLLVNQYSYKLSGTSLKSRRHGGLLFPTYTYYETEFMDNEKQFEVGVGYFKTFKKSRVFEVYGGGGFGNVFHEETTEKRDDRNSYLSTTFKKYSANTSHFFIQPSIGFSKEDIDLYFPIFLDIGFHMDYLDFAFSSRFVGYNFSDLETDGSISNNYKSLDKQMFLFIEPTLTLRMGWKYFQFQFQTIVPLKLNTAPMNYSNLKLNFGLHIDIAPRHRTK